MSVATYQVEYGTHTIPFTLERRARKTLEISVYPDMKVEVIAPLNAALDGIMQKVKKRARWILRQIRFFEQFHPKRPERCYLSGETHLYLGRQYRLKVIPHVQRDVKLSRGQLLVQTHHPNRPAVTRDIVEDWYFERAKQKLIERVEHCLGHFQDKEQFEPKGILIRQLSQRWGSMTPAGNLVLNRQLIKAPLPSIDYVIIHELCHLQHADHSRDFYHLLGRIMPDWEKHKMRLERMVS
jgi:hypothetical protein